MKFCARTLFFCLNFLTITIIIPAAVVGEIKNGTKERLTVCVRYEDSSTQIFELEPGKDRCVPYLIESANKIPYAYDAMQPGREKRATIITAQLCNTGSTECTILGQPKGNYLIESARELEGKIIDLKFVES